MKALKNLGIDKLLENALKKKDFAEGFTIGRAIGLVQGANALADKISPIVAKLLRNGSPEGGQLMNIIKEVRKLGK
ncbi:hypothetical protein [Trichococcus sp.]|uniref:hypothetical protein n=1 Tax=Trichococcus sp. TaxID=1985464 RepID=UPI003C7DB21E